MKVKHTWPWERTDQHSKKTCIYVDDIFRGLGWGGVGGWWGGGWGVGGG